MSTAAASKSKSTSILTNGWLFDIYHVKDKIVLWIKEKNGNVKRLEYPWYSNIYIASNSKSELKRLIKNNKVFNFIKEHEFVYKFENPPPSHYQYKKEVLKLCLKDSSQVTTLAKIIEKLCKKFGQYRLYNVDISPEQIFLYEKDIYPLGLYDIEEQSSVVNPLQYHYPKSDKNDSIDSFDYLLPDFRFLSFNIISERKKFVSDFSDRILKINLVLFDRKNNIRKKFFVSEDTELETILEFSYEINRLDPDIILTNGGDQYLFPHLFSRAKANKIEAQLLINLNRELDQEFLYKKNTPLLKRDFSTSESTEPSSTSYVSYGKTYFKPRPFYLYGRIHIDADNSFIYKENGLDGLTELSRICRIPLQLASRSTIGKCLSSLYFYNASQRDILIPWKPITSEIFKSFYDLLESDKGGFVFESKPGSYNDVAEFDFVSLYPNIMLKKNISSETINCECCKLEKDNKVPTLEHLYHLCTKRIGIVPLSLRIILERRLEYKRRKNNCNYSSNINQDLRDCYNNRQSALKWILVTSFGYLGFSNSKFGRIDAHIAVCAFARDILLKTSKIAENHGFEIIHGIVDSIWLNRIINEKDYSFRKKITISYDNIKKDIEEQTGFSISFEGIYKWIVFDSSKINSELPALNRYFGVFKDGTIKTRGIEIRKHDTPQLFVNFQNELLQLMSTCNNVDEIVKILPILELVYKKYIDLVQSNKVPYTDLIFTKRISKNSNEYSDRKTVENCIIKILSNNGKLLYAGEMIKYIITDFYNENFLNRALPIELVDIYNIKYDEKRYLELLYEVFRSITKKFYNHPQ